MYHLLRCGAAPRSVRTIHWSAPCWDRERKNWLSRKLNVAEADSAETAGSISQVAKGTAFEMESLHALSKWRFNLARVGSPFDGGVDLQGVWELPSSRVKVVGQCKLSARSVGARPVRELEGVIRHNQLDSAFALQKEEPFPGSTGMCGVLGLLAVPSSVGFSREAYKYLAGSNDPIILVGIKGGALQTVKASSAVERLLPRLIVGATYEWVYRTDSKNKSGRALKKVPSLYFKGEEGLMCLWENEP